MKVCIETKIFSFRSVGDLLFVEDNYLFDLKFVKKNHFQLNSCNIS